MINSDSELAKLLLRGRIYYNVEGDTREKIISNIINNLIDLPEERAEILLKAVLEREALVSTGIESGIALPHPRTPEGTILIEGENPFVAIAFPANPVDWGTPDNEPVHTVFLIVSESPKQHLNALTKINFLCMDDNFINLLKNRAAKEEIITAVEEAEKGWVR